MDYDAGAKSELQNQHIISSRRNLWVVIPGSLVHIIPRVFRTRRRIIQIICETKAENNQEGEDEGKAKDSFQQLKSMVTGSL
jgi:hypothetical protein